MTKKQLITESELLQSVSRLKERIALEEQGGFFDKLGNWIGTAVGKPVAAVQQGYQAVKQAGSDLAAGAKQGYQQATGAAPAAPAAPAQGQAAKPAKPAAKSDPAVLKLQQDLIAKGAKIKADGIMGPQTQAAMKQFGTDAAPAAAPAAPAPAAPAAPAIKNPYQGADAEKFAALTPQDQEWLTRGGGVPNINDPIILSRAPNQGKPAAAPAPAPVKESVGYDEVQRIVSLVHHR